MVCDLNFLTIHSSIFVATLFAYYRYGDRSDILSKSHTGNGSALKFLRSKLSGDLAEHLKPVFKNAPVNASPIISVGGQTSYIEKPANITESESYKEAIKTFFESDTNTINSYLSMYCSSILWNRHTKNLTRIIIALMIWQGLCILICLFGELFEYEICNIFLKVTLVITALLIFIALLFSPLIEKHHAKMIDIRREYDSI